MTIKMIDYGFAYEPKRAHLFDVGADVYSTKHFKLSPGETYAVPLGFGLELPHGYGGFILPRSSMAKKGMVCQIPPIDPEYTGEIHAIITNQSNKWQEVKVGERIGQLVIMPVLIASFSTNIDEEKRGANGFGSTGK